MTPAFHISDSAFQQLSSLQKTKNQFLRISVTSGGCSGFQYHFDLESQKHADDVVIEKDGVTVVIDATSYPFLENGHLSYEQELIGSYFKITNPNAEKSCGCGSSFSI
jgi:iron-sulfur cluster insertion protein